MSWILWAQVAALALIVYILIVAGIGHVIDKRREDAMKRKEAGL